MAYRARYYLALAAMWAFGLAASLPGYALGRSLTLAHLAHYTPAMLGLTLLALAAMAACGALAAHYHPPARRWRTHRRPVVRPYHPAR